MEINCEEIDKMFDDAESQNGDLKVDIMGQEYRLDSNKIDKEKLHKILKQLPDSFQEKSGGGMSFLNACMDKNNKQWGEQRNVALLMGLGIATGLAYYCLPKEMWQMLPGGVPYFGIKD